MKFGDLLSLYAKIPRPKMGSELSCSLCGVLDDDYMVSREVWLAVSMASDGSTLKRLCLHCLQARLDRPLRVSDFYACPVNRKLFLGAILQANETAKD